MRWLDVKYGKEEARRQWIKVHLMCGVKANIVASVEVSDGYGFFDPFGEISRTCSHILNCARVVAQFVYRPTAIPTLISATFRLDAAYHVLGAT